MIDALSVILAAAAAFAAGAVWYGVFAKPWMAAVGMTEAEIKAAPSATPFVIAGVAALASALALFALLSLLDRGGVGFGALLGLGAGALIAAPWTATHTAFAGRPRALIFIDGGHVILALTLAGAVLGAFR